MILFQSIAAVMTPRAKGEMIIQIPRITLAQLQAVWLRTLVRMIANTATTMPTITLFHIAAGNCENWTIKGEMITQMPNAMLSQLDPAVFA